MWFGCYLEWTLPSGDFLAPSSTPLAQAPISLKHRRPVNTGRGEPEEPPPCERGGPSGSNFIRSGAVARSLGS